MINTTSTLRPMTAEDLPAVVALWRETEGVGLAPDETESMLAGYLERNASLSTVAVADGAIVGAVLCGHDGRRGYLYHLAVSRSQRGQGVGRRLVESCVSGLRACGLGRASILVYSDNAEGRAFWEHLGWKSRDDLRLMQLPL